MLTVTTPCDSLCDCWRPGLVNQPPGAWSVLEGRCRMVRCLGLTSVSVHLLFVRYFEICCHVPFVEGKSLMWVGEGSALFTDFPVSHLTKQLLQTGRGFGFESMHHTNEAFDIGEEKHNFSTVHTGVLTFGIRQACALPHMPVAHLCVAAA